MSQSTVTRSQRSPADALLGVPPTSRPGPSPRTSSRWLLGVLSGLAAAALVTALRSTGVLVGAAAFAAAACLVVLVPTARTLSHRIAVSGAMLAGGVPALWWVLLPSPGLRATLLLAGATGGLVTYLVVTGRRGLRRLRPSVAPVDAVPLGAALAGLWILRPWLTVRTAAGALQMLLSGWDFSAHAAMALGDRAHGGTVDVWATQAGGETWKFREYPQGFHTAVATLVELWQPRLGTPGEELLLTTRAFGLVALLATVLVVAALCGLPGLRRRPGWALGAGAAVVAALLLGPGATALAEGFPNFLYAAALASCVTVMAAWREPAMAGRVLLGLVALEVAAAQAWVLLAVAVAPVVGMHLVSLWRSIRARRSDMPAWLLLASAAALAVGAGRAVAQVLGTLSVADTLVIDGGIATPDRREVVILVLPALALAVLALRTGTGEERSSGTGWAQRAVPLVAMVGVGGVTAAVAGVQVLHGTHLGYYFWKMVAGASILAVPAAATAVAWLVGPPSRRTFRDRTVAAGVAGVCALTASQFFGLTFGGTSLAPGMAARTQLTDAQRSPSATATQLVAAASATSRATPGGTLSHVVFLAPVAEGASALGAQQWYLALVGAWTVQANGRVGVLIEPGTTSWPYGERGRDVLATDPLAHVLVAPPSLGPLQATLDPGVAARAGTWPDGGSGPVAAASGGR